jgi:hypothetical protein
MVEKTVRELAGEIWAELQIRCTACTYGESPLRALDSEALSAVTDIVLGVLARHSDTVIINDRDFPVAPLEPTVAE